MLSAIKTYRTNFLEYRLTGDQKYKKAADGAMDSINREMEYLEDTVNSLPPIPHKTHINQNDKLIAAQMRTPAISSFDWRYYVIAALVITSLVVKV
jgi:hypothetical protein